MRIFLLSHKLGRDLAALHLNYETVPLYTGISLVSRLEGLALTEQGVIGGNDSDFRVEQMKFAKKKDPKTGKSIDDKTTLIYNGRITIENIPEEAYEYVVGGKSALEQVMGCQTSKPKKQKKNNSGIADDANDWACEIMGNARYPLELFLRMITVSLETCKIVRNLPQLDIKEEFLEKEIPLKLVV
ncbi:type ISP restriction/modification enzyme [Bartonella sp. B35(2025)]